MSFSLYISALAISDTIVLVNGKWQDNYYRAPMKLREDNVFTHLCHSVQAGKVWVCLVLGPLG